MFVKFQHLGRSFRFLGDPVKLSDVPRMEGRPPPLLGQHNDYVFGDLLGMSHDEIRAMKLNGAM